MLAQYIYNIYIYIIYIIYIIYMYIIFTGQIMEPKKLFFTCSFFSNSIKSNKNVNSNSK